MDEFIADKVPAVVQELVSTKVIKEVKNRVPALVPDDVADIVRPCLHKVVSLVLRPQDFPRNDNATDADII
ncbi:hypothetical protein Tco_1156559 [Tanacetum coccineum]